MVTIKESGERFAKEYSIRGTSKRTVQELFIANEFRDEEAEFAFCGQKGSEEFLCKENVNVLEKVMASSLRKLHKSRNKAMHIYREYLRYACDLSGEDINVNWNRIEAMISTPDESSDRLERQINFILEADRIKSIFRQTYIASGERKENDAEHSWHLALMAYLLKEHANADVNLEKVMLMVLIHDMVEIDAGDTYAYDEEGYITKAARERAAADRIFGILPENQGEYLKGLWEEFELGQSMEAKYANSLDRMQPMLLNGATQCKSWEEHEVTYDKVCKRFSLVKDGSEVLWARGQRIIDENRAKLSDT